jgi:hypothetical protein
MHADLGDGLLCAVLGRVLACLDLTDDLNVCAFGQASGIIGGTSKSDALIQVVCASRAPVSRFFQVRLVASERTVRVKLLRVGRDSASEPR